MEEISGGALFKFVQLWFVYPHKAAFKLLNINTEKYLNLCERYFWALSMAPTIQPHILEGIIHL